jgi:hypothetical protein
MTTLEVRAMLGGLSQGRISQLVKEGALVVERDPEGRLRYDRIAAERLARNRAARQALDAEGIDERKALQAEARDRLRRERERREQEERRRQEWQDDLRTREVKALEGIAECLRRR